MYDFTDGETQLMRICIDAMHTAGLAFIVQGISTMLLGEASANYQHILMATWLSLALTPLAGRS